MMPSFFSRALLRLLAASIACAAILLPPARAQDLERLQGLLSAAAPGSWIKISTTTFSSAFPSGQDGLPESGVSDAGAVVRAWSSFTWDSNRGNLLLFGGGHYNYIGNEIYILPGATGVWTRGSLPSFVEAPDFLVGDNSAPQSAHTYDNNNFLPINDRFLTFGGATHPYGGTFRAMINGVETRTGPWMWDPELADADKVGGSSGSGFNPATAGGAMWTDRRLSQSGATLASAINGTTAYRSENGKDVVYVTSDANQSGLPNLYRYTVGNLANGENDQIEWIGRTFNGVAHEGAATIDTKRNLFVRTTGHPELAADLHVYKLTGASSSALALSFVVDLVNQDGSAFSIGNAAGIDYDEVLDQYFVWDGSQKGTVYTFRAESDSEGNLLPIWHVTMMQSPSQAQPAGKFLTGVFGKWKYVKQLGAFVALDEYNSAIGDAGVWLYKPAPLGAAPVDNALPTVALTSPAANTSYSIGSVVTLTASASDTDGNIAKVEFFDGATSLGVATTAPYSITWTPSLGLHSLTARATDNRQASRTSAAVSVSVNEVGARILCAAEGAICNLPAGAVGDVYFGKDAAVYVKRNVTGSIACSSASFGGDPAPGKLKSCTYALSSPGSNAPPTVALTSPTASDTYTAGTTITLRATASDSDGNVVQVEFFDGATSLGTVTNAPYVRSLVAVQGAHSFTARATDNLGAQTTSAAVALTVGAGVNGTFCANENAICALPGGAVADVYYGASGVFAVKRNATGNVACTSANFGGDPISGQAKSCFYTLVNPGSNAAPIVALTSPISSGTYAAGASVTLAATASDGDGSVAKVEFFDGSTLLGSATSAPYSFIWAATSGSHSFTARATDNLGAQTTSAAVALTIAAGNTTFCANENAICALPAGAVADVYYGANGVFAIKRNATGNVLCSNGTFGGDPISGQFKTCSYTLTNQGSNTPPNVALTSPTVTDTYAAGATVTLSATASDSGGSVVKVEFFDGATSLGSATTAPFSINWVATQGAHSFTARATDNLGAQTTSAAVALTIAADGNTTLCAKEGAVCVLPAGALADVYYGVGASFAVKRNVTGSVACTNGNFGGDPAPNQLKSCYYTVTNPGSNVPPTVALLSPTASGTYAAGATVSFSAAAQDNDGSIAKVEYFDGAVLLGSSAVAPFAYDWTATPGMHSFTAKATDNLGAQTTSAAVVVSIAAGGSTIFCANENGICSLPAGGVADVYYGANGVFTVKRNLTGNVPCTSSYFGGDPVQFVAKACFYALTNQGGNVAPSIALTSPTATDSFAAGSNVTLSANVSDSDGTIAKVEFFDGTTLLGTVTTTSYSVNWVATLGTHTLTARATDNLGAQTTSAAVVIQVSTGNNMTLCANESGICTLPVGAVADVYYGVPGLFLLKHNVAGSVACTNQAFGSDPAVGQFKKCYYVVTN